jgi:glycosyltransferase involved in cell wall biosynthesis
VKSYVTGKLAKDREILNAWMSECHSGGAHIRLIPDIYSSAEMVDLFRFATVFATASRGEGYCLPAAQAMSCAKPVLAASWSALADLVSIPVQYRLENVARQISLPGYDTVQRWAVIDEDDLARQLAWVHSHRAEAARLGRDSREWILQQASLPVVGRFLSSRLDRLCEFPKQASMEALP